MPNLNSARPTRKVVSGALAAGLTTIVVWIVKLTMNIEVPGDVVGAMTTVLGFATAYLVPSAPEDLVAASTMASLKG